MKTAEQVVKELQKANVFENQNMVRKIEDGIKKYIKIQDGYEKNQIAEKDFQTLYCDFYKVYHVRNRAKYLSEYFKIMQKARNGGVIDENDRKKLNAISENNQGSFFSKLVHTTDTARAINDSNVRKALGMSNTENALSRIEALYNQLYEHAEFENILENFIEKFHCPEISNTKKIDFILWAYGSTL